MPMHAHPRAAIIGHDDDEAGGTSARGRRASAEAADPYDIADRVVDLTDVVRDVHEFWGARELGYFVFYWVLGILVLFMHWGIAVPIVKSNVQQTFLGFGDPPTGSGYELTSVSSLYDGAFYIWNYASSFVNTSDSRQLANNAVQIDEYSTVRYMRLSAALQKNCNYDQLPCYTDPGAPRTFNLTGHWTTVDSIAGVVGLGPMVIAELVGSAVPTRALSISIITDLAADLAYVANYAYFLSIDMVVTNQLNEDESVYLSLQVSRQLGAFNTPDQVIDTGSVSTSLSAGLYKSNMDKARIVMEVLFVCMNLWYLVKEGDIAYMAYQQFGASGTRRYLGATWTQINLVGFLLTGVWCWWYVSLLASDMHLNRSPPVNAVAVNEALQFGTSLQLWMFVGIVSNLLLGVRMLKYMDLHASLRIYAKVLSHTWRTLRDFLFFFVYLILLMGTAVLAFFQISGGNPAFVTIQDAVQSMALLTFGFMDFATFRNEGLGLGKWQPTVIVVFWVVVMILIIICQNIILSIVVYAYEEAKHSEPYIEASIFTLFLHRISFNCRWIYSRLKLVSLDEFADNRVKIFHHELFCHGRGHESNGLFSSYLYARWAICQLPEVMILRNFFYDFGHQKFVKQSRWDPAFQHFAPSSNALLQRSFGHMLNKVQDSQHVVDAILATQFLPNLDEEALRAEPAGARSSISIQTVFKSIALSSEDQRSSAGMASSKVTPILLDDSSRSGSGSGSGSGSEGLEGAASQGKEKVGPASRAMRKSMSVKPHSKMVGGGRMAASCEEPLDEEHLRHLMTKVIPQNERFTGAHHVFNIKLSKFSQAHLDRAVDFIMTLYSFPRAEAKAGLANATAAVDPRRSPIEVQKAAGLYTAAAQTSGPSGKQDVRSIPDLPEKQQAWQDQGSAVPSAPAASRSRPSLVQSFKEIQ